MALPDPLRHLVAVPVILGGLDPSGHFSVHGLKRIAQELNDSVRTVSIGELLIRHMVKSSRLIGRTQVWRALLAY